MQMVHVIGNLGGDPDTRYTNDGTAICTFSVATTERWRDRRTQEQKERTTWFRCECWARRAEVAAQYLHKGSKVYVQGKITTSEYPNKQYPDVTMYAWTLRVDNFQFLDPRPDGQGQYAPPPQGQQPNTQGPPPPGSYQQQPAQAPQQQPQDAMDFEDDIPF